MAGDRTMIRAFFVLVLAATAVAAAMKSDRDFAGLVGPARKVTTDVVVFRVEPDGTRVEQRREPVESVTYSKSGILVERVVFARGAQVAKASYQPAGEDAKLMLVDNPVDVGLGWKRTRLRPG